MAVVIHDPRKASLNLNFEARSRRDETSTSRNMPWTDLFTTTAYKEGAMADAINPRCSSEDYYYVGGDKDVCVPVARQRVW